MDTRQEIAEMVTLAKIKMGELLNDLPKGSGGDRKSQDFKIKIEPPVDFDFGKKEITKTKPPSIWFKKKVAEIEPPFDFSKKNIRTSICADY